MQIQTGTRRGAQPRRRRGTAGVARRLLAGAAVSGVVVGGINVSPTFAAPATVTAAFSGQTGTVLVGGLLYAKQGATVTLTVSTSSDTQCVDVAGAFTGHQQSDTPRSSWTFTTTADALDGQKSVTATASAKFNNNNICSGASGSGQAYYVQDNTAPVVNGVATPASNTAKWNNTDVTVKWTATDTGSGVAAAQPFQTDVVSTNGIKTLTVPGQSDRLGNTGAGASVTVRVDKVQPKITAAQTKNADGTTTVTFTCDDTNLGGDQDSGIATCLADGSTTNSKTVQPGTIVTGTATDAAGNTATATSTAPAGDTTAPLLSGAPTTPPNSNQWYQGDVTIHWTASDPESGIPTAPADTTITGEGQGLTSTQTVKNGAGLSTTATSSPAVNIDRTAPTTSISGTSNNWVNGNVTVSLAAKDNLSQVASTTYSVDGGAAQTGTSFTLSSNGDHTVTFSSTDKAGNAEVPQTAHVKIDQIAPTISHAFTTPLNYKDGAWTNQDVTVTFTCADQGGSGVASCSPPVTKTAETSKAGDSVTGTATDGAGNSATDTASVRIDKTKPIITATPDRDPNSAGWYNDDVTVTYAASDVLSGVSGSPKADVLGEGADQSASATVTDAAGNSASAGVTGINVDKTPPTLDGSFSSGWHTGDVTVSWTCGDTLSGPAGQPADTIVTGEGSNLSATASCTDKAGNPVTKTVDGIKIDSTAPTTTATVPAVPASGWYTGPVQVTLTGSDDVSGVAATYYSVDGGSQQSYTGPFSVSADGQHTVKCWSVDNAGNVETASAPITLQIDKTAPTTTKISPISPDSNWFVTSGISFAFSAKDAGSGVAATYYTIDGSSPLKYGDPFTQDLSTGTHHVTFWSVDLAGNLEKVQAFDVNVDITPPTITGDTVNADGTHRAANAAGWFNSPVNVKFTCADVGSGVQTGVAGCAGDTTLTNDGAGQKVHGTAVDVAGNPASTDFGPVNIDQTKPTLTGVPADGNSVGWHKGDVTIKWVGDDALSQIDPTTQPADSTITGEGSNLGAGPVAIKDKAGNESDPASVTGIKIDRTAPVVSGAPTTQPNKAGWYKDSVTIDFTCTDPKLADGTDGSGVASCPTSQVLSTDGADQSVTSDAARDVAGNTSAGKVVGGIDIDGTAPTTTAANMCTEVNGWCTGDSADVVLTATDQAGLSGVKEIHYLTDGGSEQVVPGATATVKVPLSGTGAGTVTYWAVDNADNVEMSKAVSLKWDNLGPTVTHKVSPTPNALGWTNADTTVTFSAKDDANGSGVDASTLTAPVTVSQETSGQDVVGSAKDLAGNLGTDKATVMLDKTPPTITGAITSGTKGNNGWYVGPVTVTWTCADDRSGVATCPDPVVVSANGPDQSVAGTVTDEAGNTATASVDGINIDQTKPTLTTAGVNVQGNTYTLGSVPAATCTATDSFSGVASCTVTVSGGNANGVGTFTYTATATDKAGNSTTITGTYSVIYRWDGFLQPINDTAHQVGTSTSIFKAGSTVPVKFQLKTGAGTVVQSAGNETWLTPVRGGLMSQPVDATVQTVTADSGSTFRYDATAQQYIYNWKTPSTGGNYYQIGVKLDDGQTYFVTIGLR